MTPATTGLSEAAQAALDAIAAYSPTSAARCVLARAGGADRRRRRHPRVEAYLSRRVDAPGANIQGNIVPGLQQGPPALPVLPHHRRLTRRRSFCVRIAPSITSMDEALGFVRAHRAHAAELGRARAARARRPPGSTSPSRAAASRSWRPGPASVRRAELPPGTGGALDLPRRPDRSRQHPGHRSRWKVGGPHNEADILVIVAGDTTDGLDRQGRRDPRLGRRVRLELIFEQRGDTLPGHLRGHEHFGFKDGVSQPGIRGKVSDRAGRLHHAALSRSGGRSRPAPVLFARPGQPLVWPGQFLLGEPRQSPQRS